MDRRTWLLVFMAATPPSDQSLLVRREGDRLRVTAPQIRFLNGRPLETLRNGASVSFASQISLSTISVSSNSVSSETPPLLARHVDRFVVSYDLWEEKFSAMRPGPPQRSVSRLTGPATEAWCLDQALPIPSALTPQRRFSVRLELRAEDPRETASVVGEPGINITRLIEIFSRPPRTQQPRWVAGAGPLRLEDLK